MKKILIIAVTVAFSAAFVACDQAGSKKSTAIETASDTVAYEIGNSIGNNLKMQFSEVNPDILAEAIVAAFEGEENKIFTNPQEGQMYIQSYMQKAEAKKGEANKVKGEEFLAENAKKEGIKVTESGLQYEVISEGTGAKPTAEDKVSVTYHGTTIDGEVFDSSVERGDTVSFPVNGVIKGWTEGLQMMAVGSKYKFYIPADLAYGERGAGGAIGPNSALIFDVELIGIE